MLERNTALTRSLRALAHPITVGAVILLLVNDHLLRVMWPSWWTGKIGDFAWLAFFPAALAVPLALIVPARVRRRDATVAALAFGITGGMFAAMKTIPAAMEAGLWVLRLITGGPFILRADPTDLLALPGLAIGWWVWDQPAAPAPSRRAWAALALGALATLANSSPAILDITGEYPRGIVRLLYLSNGDVIAREDNSGGVTPEIYASENGGLTWHQGDSMWRGDIRDVDHEPGQAWELADPDDPNIIYKFIPNGSIQRSTDGGSTWTTEVDVHWTQAQVAYEYVVPQRLNRFRGGPFDAVINKRHGTVVVAMGGEGILTRTKGGKWLWVSVNNSLTGNEWTDLSPRSNLDTPEKFLRVLMPQFWLAVSLLFLTPGFLGYFANRKFPSTKSLVWGFFALVTWWVIFIYTPIGTDAFGHTLFKTYSAWPLLVFTIIFTLFGLNGIIGYFKTIPALVWLTMLIAVTLFLLPFVLWSQNLIPDLIVASILAGLLSWLAIGWGCFLVYRYSLKWESARREQPALDGQV
jgi:hypothetical protein